MRKLLLIFFTLTCLSFHSSASHIAGGGFVLTWLHDSVYHLQLIMTREFSRSVTLFDNSIIIGRFAKSDDTRITTDSMHLDSIKSNLFDTNYCYKSNPGVSYEVGYYNRIITFSPKIYNDAAGYYISFERCCRNLNVTNISDPGLAGISYYLEIPTPSLFFNSSPRCNSIYGKILCKQ
ncbi:MAG: hypothetical protein ACHQK8_07265, partial [Bacteroidia bacterium]